ncbi:type II toxin-antitoxin system RelE/ParE family toxin [Pedobacter chinensis]|uniref:Type II toxin-antitoxin system RelE/ParE family toxin n=1 Tax=Pedobacter chinensis TaxID=2282421 RepID=A0A369PX72_9SPHI|nr:type II toxin-antitoxin system RelE/ParE family toxin [Pedobacter chinensis]RDC56840.1 type II toxin-antitoxin system RelE/ParE family toxin [Pedobacter chinensis]
MELSVSFSEEAYETLLAIAIFIEENWGYEYARKFIHSTYQKIDLVAQQPFIYEPISFNNTVRKGVISKYTSFYYQIHQEEIRILFFFDNRQEPLIT